MAFVLKFAKTIRNHWKKSIFLTSVSVYGVKYARDKHDDELIRRAYCDEAKEYGHQYITLTQKPKKIYVFLNPAAQGNNGRKLFEKNAAPLLHLSGFEVVLVKTEFEGQAKDFMSVLDINDLHAVVVAGGDGTLSEVVTGILRKGDRKFERTVPIGILPVGYTNRFARQLFGYGPEKNEVQAIADATLAVVKGQTRKVDVLSIQSEEGKATYALSGLEMGAFRDAVARKNKYWYFGPLKYRWTYMRTIMKNWPPTLKGKLTYVPSNVEVKIAKPEKVANPAPQQWSWWNMFFTTRPSISLVDDEDEDDNDLIDYSKQEVNQNLDTVEFTVMSNIYSDDPSRSTKTGVSQVDIGVGPSEPSRSELLQEGWRRINSDTLRLGTDTNQHIQARMLKLVLEESEGEDVWFTIDGEHYEAKPIEIKVLKNRLNFFYLQDADN